MKNTTRFFVVRHGETEGNQKKIYRGRWDLPLNENGIRQVERAGEALKAVSFDVIYTSPLVRTRQTAAALARWQQVDPLEDEALIDIDYGQWTRVADSDVAEKQPALYQKWKESPELVTFPGGEGLADVRKRVTSALERWTSLHAGQAIALCGHRVSVKMILMVAMGMPDSAFWKLRVDTASLSVLNHFGGDFSLVMSNETCHLAPLGEKLGMADF
jgi:phosphoserine phosphatase